MDKRARENLDLAADTAINTIALSCKNYEVGNKLSTFCDRKPIQ